jgi:predicted nucleic acid-binding protein
LTIYADSSFVTSLYVRDVHSSEAHVRMSQKSAVGLTSFNRVELAHSIHFQVFRGRIDLATARVAWKAFEQDCAAGIWTENDLPQDVWDRAIDLASQYGPVLGVRTLDSLHVACALELGAQKFWTFDERQAKLAAAVGLSTTA